MTEHGDCGAYVSNTAAGTSNNYGMFPPDTADMPCVRTYRVCIRPQQAGRLSWRFWYSNTVDSTWSDGKESAAGFPGGEWKIVHACAYASDGAGRITRPPVSDVTFGGKSEKDVLPGECFASDPVELTVADGGYLVYSWAILPQSRLTRLPATPDSQVPCFTAPGDRAADETPAAFVATLDPIPMPNLFAAGRQVEKRIAFLGDSITQGIGTGFDRYEHWVARISKELGDRFSVWNIGLGYGRAQDAAAGGAWLRKAMRCDQVCVCFGVNDILSGGRGEAEILADLTRIVSLLKADRPARDVILFTVPAFDLTGEQERIRRAVNTALREKPPEGTAAVFDFSAVVSMPAPEDHLARYGGHPDGRGGAAVAQAFLDFYRARFSE